MYKLKSVWIVLALILILIISSAIYSYAATNTVPASTLGEGSGTISGYIVSNLQYSLNSSNPSNIDEVSFSLDSSASTVKIKLVSSGATFYDCSLAAGTWSCATTSPQATVLQADELTVIAGE
ncbi:MAG: hypothetical protein J7M01_01590 [Candidatus Marinimicrobia bacterium]|nr:hypothetical protein [Candidatus Neomarinimicrobiota bacterium]